MHDDNDVVTDAICLRINGGGESGRDFGQGERDENIILRSNVETKVQLETPATPMTYARLVTIEHELHQKPAVDSRRRLCVHKV